MSCHKKSKAKFKLYRRIALCLAAALCLCACARAEYAHYELTPNVYMMGEDGSTYSPDGASAQLTADNIMKLNGGNAHMVFDADGYLTFLNGKYYSGKIASHEDAIESIKCMAQLLGLSAGSEFFAKYGETDDDGYTYYTFQQRYGDATVMNATLRVIVDQQGYAAGLSSSFLPNIGIAEPVDPITPEQANEVVKNKFPTIDLTYYPEATAKVVVTLNDVAYNAYAVYTNNPYMTESFEMSYYEHFISYSGEYLYNTRVSSTVTENADPFKASAYFDGLEPMRYSGEIRNYDGTTKHIEVPIAYNPADGLYYLCDTERKIMVTDYSAFDFHGQLEFITSTDGKTWKDIHLHAYNNYIRAYDFYAAYGINSVDDFGTPILVCVGLRDGQGNPVKNAFHFGMNQGWVSFASSDDFSYAEALDITAHEYTHGVTTYSMGGNVYENATGAINEAYSDIMGNICEMYMGATTDTQWLIGETCGEAMRSMSSPHDFYQPTSLSDQYYQPETSTPNDDNDLGGVHQNSSLLNSVAYKLYASGMPLEDEAALWAMSIELITPLSGYREVHGALLMSVDINGLDPAYKQVITDAFDAAELL